MVAKLYVFRFMDGLLPILSLYLVLFREEGISPIQISSLLILASIVYIVFEIPSGALADTYSKRRLLVFGELLRALGYGAWLVLPNYFGFALGFILWGVSSAFISGTYQALLYDDLRARGTAKQYVAIMGRAQSIALIARAAAAGLASLSILAGYWLVLAISIAASVAAAIVASRFPNPPSFEKVEKHYFTVLRRAFGEIFEKRQILLAILGVAVMAGALAVFIEEYSQLFMAAVGIAKPLIPVLVLAIILPPVLIGFAASRFETIGVRTLFAMLIFTGMLLAIAGYLASWVGIIALGLALCIAKLVSVLLDGTMQHAIDSHSRVTIASVRESSAELMTAVLYACYGVISNYRGDPAAYIGIGLLTIFIGVVYTTIYVSKRFRAAASSRI